MYQAGSVLFSTALMVAVIGLLQFIVLAFRNPNRPAWLRTSAAETWVTIAGVSLFSVSLCYQVAALIEAEMPAAPTIAGVPVFVVLVAIFIWRRFRCGDRLRRADAGLSPFDGDPLLPLPLPGETLGSTIALQSERH